MATSTPAGKRSAENELLEGIGELIDDAAEKLTIDEFAKVVKKSTATLDRAIAAHSRQRGRLR